MDPYGTDLLLTDDGDLSVTPAGGLATITGPWNCAQAMIGRLRVAPGELPLHPDYGNAINRKLIGGKSNDPTLAVSQLNTELRQIIQQDSRFLRAEQIRATIDPRVQSAISISASLVLAGGDSITASDLTGSPGMAAFTAEPILADTLTPSQLDSLAIANADDGDDVPELDEVLEGAGVSSDVFTGVIGRDSE